MERPRTDRVNPAPSRPETAGDATAASILWRRLDTPGHDACRLDRREAGWQLEGMAVFRLDGAPAWLAYSLDCDLAWYTRRGRISGWLHRRSVAFSIVRTAGGVWTLDGVAVPGLEGCVDLDLSFTPATNLPQLRRLGLAPGQAADAPVAWLDVSAGTLSVLPQRYERRGAATYWYEAPSVGYAALLEVIPIGFIRKYPELWEAES
jgi:hypothetical protein